MEFTERRGGGCCCCCVTHRSDAALKMGRIMLQYRPIAPKPSSAASPGIRPDDTVSTKRGGWAREGKRGRKARRVKDYPTLLRKEIAPTIPSPTSSNSETTRVVQAAGAWVTVESVTETWSSESSDEGVRRAMEGCPGFVSEGERVVWINEEFRRMMVGEEEVAEVRVALVTRGLMPEELSWRGLTCRVTVRYVCMQRGRVMLAAPCDVWRMDGGGLAWRVDVKAALSLSLG